MTKTDMVITKLEVDMRNMADSLTEIKKDIKILIAKMGDHHTDVELVKNDLNNLGKKVEDIERRLKHVEKQQTGLLVKVAVISTGIAGFLGWRF